MKRLTHSPKVSQSETGMVSIMTVLIFMIVISLTVIGFEQISLHNSQNTLNSQLSTQAFYAAESGINDVRNVLNGANGQPSPDNYNKTDCATPTSNGPYSTLSPYLNGNGGDIKYSCLTVNVDPTVLNYSSVGPDTSTVIPLVANTGTISSIELNVQPEAGSSGSLADCPNNTNNIFTPDNGTAWTCAYGVLRFDLVPVSGNLSISSLSSSTMTVFAVPLSSGGASSVNYAEDSSNSIGMQCYTTPNDGCSLQVNNLPAGSYYMRVSSLYSPVGLAVSASPDATYSPNDLANLVNAQAVIDSTGNANGVLRRIQVSIPLTPNGGQNQAPDYAIQSTNSICKEFAVSNNFFQDLDPSSANCSY